MLLYLQYSSYTDMEFSSKFAVKLQVMIIIVCTFVPFLAIVGLLLMFVSEINGIIY